MKYKHIPNAGENFIKSVFGRPCPDDPKWLSIGDHFRNAFLRGREMFCVDLVDAVIEPDPGDACLVEAVREMRDAFCDIFSRQRVEPDRLSAVTLEVTWRGPLTGRLIIVDDRGVRHEIYGSV